MLWICGWILDIQTYDHLIKVSFMLVSNFQITLNLKVDYLRLKFINYTWFYWRRWTTYRSYYFADVFPVPFVEPTRFATGCRFGFGLESRCAGSTESFTVCITLGFVGGTKAPAWRWMPFACLSQYLSPYITRWTKTVLNCWEWSSRMDGKWPFLSRRWYGAYPVRYAIKVSGRICTDLLRFIAWMSFSMPERFVAEIQRMLLIICLAGAAISAGCGVRGWQSSFSGKSWGAAFSDYNKATSSSLALKNRRSLFLSLEYALFFSLIFLLIVYHLWGGRKLSEYISHIIGTVLLWWGRFKYC